MVHYRINKRQPLNRMLRQLSPVHTLTPYLFKIRCNIILLSTITSPILVKFCMNFSSPPCVLHIPPIPSSLVWSS